MTKTSKKSTTVRANRRKAIRKAKNVARRKRASK